MPPRAVRLDLVRLGFVRAPPIALLGRGVPPTRPHRRATALSRIVRSRSPASPQPPLLPRNSRNFHSVRAARKHPHLGKPPTSSRQKQAPQIELSRECPVATPFVPIPILQRLRQAPRRPSSLVFPTRAVRVQRMPSTVNQDSSSWMADPRPAPASLPPKYPAISEICLARAKMEELQLRYAAAPPSCEEDHRPPIPRLPAPRWRSQRLHLAVDALPRPHDTSVLARDSAQWAQTSRSVRARTAGSVCGKLQPRPAPAGRRAQKCARHRNFAGAPGNSA